ncbi:MAG TPA: hypothetical protein VIK78_14490 [Ruminiclostridium sp.]
MSITKTEFLLGRILEELEKEKNGEIKVKPYTFNDIMRNKTERIKCTYNLNPNLVGRLNNYCKLNNENQSDVINKSLYYFLEYK